MKKFSVILMSLMSIIFAQNLLGDINRLSNQQIDIIKNQLKDNVPIVETDKSIDLIDPGTVEVQSKTTITLDTNFGYDYFKRDINFFDNIPLPANYKLGPGDEIILSLWGEANLRERFVLNKDGSIFFTNLGFINLSNKTVDEAEMLLVSELQNIYSTLSETENKTKLRIDTGKLKSINVYFSGEVANPGINVIHPFSDIFTALVQAGGVNNSGSLRNVQLLRNNTIVATVDFYQFFTTGDKNFSNIQLLDGDVINIPLVSKRIPIAGQVVRGGSYELLSKDTLHDLIKFAGGIKPNASSIISIESIIPLEKRASDDFASSSYNLSYEDAGNIILNNGDKVTIQAILANASKVEVIGNVKSPGSYPVNGNNLKDVLDLAGGFNDPFFRKTIFEDEITVLRKDENQFFNKEFIVSYEESINFNLVTGDKIFVYENINYENFNAVTVTGEVKKRGTYQLRKGMTISDAIELSGGFTERANSNAISVSLPFVSFNMNGEVVVQNTTILNSSLNQKIISNATINVLPKQNTVAIEGNVLNPGSFAYSNQSLKKYINQAGGLRPDTLKKNIYVQRANGKIKKVSMLRGWGINIKPGDKIVVPLDPDPTDFNAVAFFADVAQIFANVAALIAIVDNTSD